MDGIHKSIGKIWSDRYANPRISSGRLKWSDSGTIMDHITRLICGNPCLSLQKANIHLIQRISSNLPYKHGISVACGTGVKEMELLENNIVSNFTCYELAEQAIQTGRQEAERRNLKERITFYHLDVFKQTFKPGSFDFVYWDNAIHHMFDAYSAMKWSKDLLSDNGCFFMFDFIGPSRFQWTDEQMNILKQILESMDDKYFLTPGSEYMWKKEPSKMTIEEMLEADPSEAADSDNIIPAFKEYFPDGTLIPLGGLIYVLGLDGILVNIPEDSVLLHKMLKLDTMLSKQGHNYYAVAYHMNSARF